jgi:hypothetical protein
VRLRPDEIRLALSEVYDYEDADFPRKRIRTDSDDDEHSDDEDDSADEETEEDRMFINDVPQDEQLEPDAFVPEPAIRLVPDDEKVDPEADFQARLVTMENVERPEWPPEFQPCRDIVRDFISGPVRTDPSYAKYLKYTKGIQSTLLAPIGHVDAHIKGWRVNSSSVTCGAVEWKLFKRMEDRARDAAKFTKTSE